MTDFDDFFDNDFEDSFNPEDDFYQDEEGIQESVCPPLDDWEETAFLGAMSEELGEEMAEQKNIEEQLERESRNFEREIQDVKPINSQDNNTNFSNSNNKDLNHNISNMSQKNFEPIFSKVVGVTFANRQEICRKLSEGEKLSLKREPENDHDKNAIKVLYCDNMCGYINSDLAAKIAPLIDDGTKLIAKVVELTGGGELSVGVNVRIQEELYTENLENESGELSQQNEMGWIDDSVLEDDLFESSNESHDTINGCNPISPTDEQKTIYEYVVPGNSIANIIAFAGTGKTTTLREYAKAHPDLRFLYLAFNRSVRLEAKNDFPNNVTCHTSHSLAFEKFGKNHQDRIINKLYLKKIKAFLKLKEYECAKYIHDTFNNFLISADKKISLKHVPELILQFPEEEPEEKKEKKRKEIKFFYVRMAAKLMKCMGDENNREIGMLHDYYLKLYQLNQAKVNYDHILLDEAQDTNPVVTDIVVSQKCPKILVGDPHQQIYSFRGAKDAMKKISAVKTFYLTNSFRFGEEIAWVANKILSTYKAEKTKLKGVKTKEQDFDPKPHAFIARTNATVFEKAAFHSEKQKKIAFIGGIKGYNFNDILDAYYLSEGAQKKIKNPYIRTFKTFLDLYKFATKYGDWELYTRCKVVEKFEEKIPEYIDNINSATTEKLDQADIILSTAHKAKGSQFSTITICNDFPPFFKQSFELDEDGVPYPTGETYPSLSKDEANLLYVTVTRAKNYIEFEDFTNILCTREELISKKKDPLSKWRELISYKEDPGYKEIISHFHLTSNSDEGEQKTASPIDFDIEIDSIELQKETQSNSSIQTYTDEFGNNFMWIEPGTFTMGSRNLEWYENKDADATQHQVTLTRGFYIQTNLVNKSLWMLIMNSQPWYGEDLIDLEYRSGRNSEVFISIDHESPDYSNEEMEYYGWEAVFDADVLVERMFEDNKIFQAATSVSWHDAKKFIEKISSESGLKYRLPTEAEWEYTYRKGNNVININEIKQNFSHSSRKLFGMNSDFSEYYEWCSDYYDKYPSESVIDPKGPESGSCHVVRGYYDNRNEKKVWPDERNKREPSSSSFGLGFRLVLETLPSTKNKTNPNISIKPEVKKSEFESDNFINECGMKFVWIKPGLFRMGSPEHEEGRNDDENLHHVTLKNGFYMQNSVITKQHVDWIFTVYKSYINDNYNAIFKSDKVSSLFDYLYDPSEFYPEKVEEMFKDDGNFASLFNWTNSIDFIRLLNNRTTVHTYRLPTEAEWEYACRAGSISRYCFGESSAQLEDYALFNNDYNVVAKKYANNWGLYDMHGNVLEWCMDWYGEYPTGLVTDPVGPTTGTERVLRGGAYDDSDHLCRSAARFSATPDDVLAGLRLVLIPTPGFPLPHKFDVDDEIPF